MKTLFFLLLTSAALFAAALVVLRVKHSNPILVMVCCGAVSLIAKFIAG